MQDIKAHDIAEPWAVLQARQQQPQSLEQVLLQLDGLAFMISYLNEIIKRFIPEKRFQQICNEINAEIQRKKSEVSNASTKQLATVKAELERVQTELQMFQQQAAKMVQDAVNMTVEKMLKATNSQHARQPEEMDTGEGDDD
jgi:ABC-type phosphate transport system auxiliary subunit